MSPQQNKTIGHFITRLKTADEDCEYGGERDNQIRDKTIDFIEDDSLKSKLFRTEDLNLEKLIQVVSEHDKAVPLKANLSVNMAKKTMNSVRDNSCISVHNAPYILSCDFVRDLRCVSEKRENKDVEIAVTCS